MHIRFGYLLLRDISCEELPFVLASLEKHGCLIGNNEDSDDTRMLGNILYPLSEFITHTKSFLSARYSDGQAELQTLLGLAEAELCEFTAINEVQRLDNMYRSLRDTTPRALLEVENRFSHKMRPFVHPRVVATKRIHGMIISKMHQCYFVWTFLYLQTTFSCAAPLRLQSLRRTR